MLSTKLCGLAPLTYSSDFSALDTRLADRTATLASPTGADSNTVADQESSMHIQAQQSSSIPPAKNQTTEAGNPKELLTAARADLAEAQRSRSELQQQVNKITTELENTRKKNHYDAYRLKSVESERIQLYSRLKDRDEELSAKGKLLEVGGHFMALNPISRPTVY